MPNHDVARLRELLHEGRCCAVAIVQVALEEHGVGAGALVQAVGALCSGVQAGLVCGALTGAACMMSALDPTASARMVPELAEWFVATMGEEYGGIDCDRIVAGDPAAQRTRCPAIVEATYLQARDLMKKYGYR